MNPPLHLQTFRHIKDYMRYYPGDYYHRLVLNNRGIVKARIFGFKGVILFGKKHLARVLNSEHQDVKVGYPYATKHILGEHALLFLPKQKHKLQRSIVMKAFTGPCVYVGSPLRRAPTSRTLNPTTRFPNTCAAAHHR